MASLLKTGGSQVFPQQRARLPALNRASQTPSMPSAKVVAPISVVLMLGAVSSIPAAASRTITGDSLKKLRTLPDESVQTCVTSPPYWGLRDYGVKGQLGLEATPGAYVARMVEIFREVRRVLKNDGTLWLNLGDSYASDTKGSGGVSHSLIFNATTETGRSAAGTVPGQRFAPRKTTHGLKPKDLVGIPWRVAFALQADGWYLRSDIIWHKPNPMPESVTDRPTKAHEYMFLLAKSQRYFYDADAIAEPAVATANRGGNVKMIDAAGIVLGRRTNPNCGLGRNWQPRESGTYSKDSGRNDGGPHPSGGFITGPTRNRRTVWSISTKPYKGAHFATFPPKLIEPCILAGSRPGDVVLDPFSGAGTTGLVAQQHGRKYLGIELNPVYAAMARKRIAADPNRITRPPIDLAHARSGARTYAAAKTKVRA